MRASSLLGLDREQEFLDKGLGIIRKNYAATVKKGRLGQAQMDERVGLISGTTVWEELGDVDLVERYNTLDAIAAQIHHGP